MLRWMCGYSGRDRTKNEDILAGVTYVEDKMQEARLIWLEHVMRRCMVPQCGRVRVLLWIDSREID